MIDLDVRVDLAKAQAMLANLRRGQIPFATAYALTQCAKAAQREVEREMPRVFDRPTPYTMRAIWTKSATKSRLWSEVKVKDEALGGNPAVRWLMPQIEGGPRSAKGFERLLQRAGVLPSGWFAVPTSYVQKDAYGNVPASVIRKILSQLQASRDPLTRESAVQKRKRNSRALRAKSRPSRYFVAYPGQARTAQMAPGIYERVAFGFGSAIRPVFVYVSGAPRYRRRLKFYDIVDRTVRAQLGLQFKRGMLLASRTAR